MSEPLAITGIALNAQEGTAPDWVQLTPAGPDLRGTDGRIWKLTDPDAVVAATRAVQAKLPLDLEHATEIKGAKGEPAEAIGWIEDLDVRDGAIWGKVDWLDEGRAIMARRSYGFVSPVFDFSKSTRAVAKLRSAALTNQPNFNMPALNRAGAPEGDPMDKDVLTALELDDGATSAQAVAAITALKADKATALNRAETPDPEKFVPRADYDRARNRANELEEAEKKRADAEIVAEVDAAVEAGKIAPSSKDYHVAACRAEGGIEKFRTFIGGAPSITEPSGLDGKAPPASTSKMSDEERAVCRQMGVSEDDFLAQKAADEGKAA